MKRNGPVLRALSETVGRMIKAEQSKDAQVLQPKGLFILRNRITSLSVAKDPLLWNHGD